MIKIKGKIYTKLNLGCGNVLHTKFPLPWLNIDIEGGVADFLCDIRHLPKNWNKKFEEVRASHVLEHLFLTEWQTALSEWIRVLSLNGILRIIVPDLDIVIRCLGRGYDKKHREAISAENQTPVMAQIYGVGYENRKTEDRWRHRMIVNREILSKMLAKRKELRDVRAYPQNEDPAYKLGIKDDSQNQFSVCVKAIKRATG